jgi:hypothetical protein
MPPSTGLIKHNSSFKHEIGEILNLETSANVFIRRFIQSLLMNKIEFHMLMRPENIFGDFCFFGKPTPEYCKIWRRKKS